MDQARRDAASIYPVVFVLVLALVPICTYIYLEFGSNINDEPAPSYCESALCYETFRHLTDTIDPKNEPCNDWYSYICGKLQRTVTHKSNLIMNLETSIEEKLKELVTTKEFQGKNRDQVDNLWYMRKFYQSCVESDVASLTPPKNKYMWMRHEKKFRSDIIQITQGWPVYKITEELSVWKQLMKYMVDAKSKGYYYELFLEVRAQTDNQTGEASVTISYPSWDMFRKHDSFWSNHHNVHRILSSFDENPTFEAYLVSDFRRDLSKIIERQMYRVAQMKNRGRKTSIHHMVRGNRFIPLSDWMLLLIQITNYTKLSPETTIEYNLYKNGFFEDLGELWRKYGSRIWGAYIAIELYLRDCDLMHMSNRIFCNIHDEYRKTCDDDCKNRCYKQAREYFPGIAEAQYVRELVPEATRTGVKKIIKHIANQIRIFYSPSVRRVNKNNGENMSCEGDKICELMQEMSPVIGGPDIAFDIEKFEETFGVVEGYIETDDFYNFRHLMARSLSNYNFKKLARLPNLNREYDLFLLKIRLAADYIFDVQKNTKDYFYISPALLQMPLYSPRREAYLNYGALGTIISTALLNVLGKKKIIFSDSYAGSEETKRISTNLGFVTSCPSKSAILAVLQNYLERDVNITWEEVAADRDASNIAYKAYENSGEPRFQDAKLLPGFLYRSTRQIFWMMSSFYLCQHMEYENIDLTLKQLNKPLPFNYYVIPRLRINMHKEGSAQFLLDFSCSINKTIHKPQCIPQ
ncbi:uncharacterized protein LOC109536009 [Dendroctonus ponderosae]|uniref:uncharacterized protein LOC109536009 n=1 Tax=Dendroctonus ponderosae TaxID=77166 RepID=UPI0020351B7F|nr:uncharacterized protein LOC109536009 [Dendroctonus ponderosae]